ncbi:hypothetical protein M2103_000353 [Ereboglobus sp. PH5-5]|uniref:hypothetical protein n=1 Tax=Ereboglobus sp. PH5-5 TaxID=2940529 RepID=UPI0024052C61|nr:hypothetical protein [Ereboglobus sp. PH5-5]MDF9832145.1 hypothetical protein [Ereboglobus sp. PH5-5]
MKKIFLVYVFTLGFGCIAIHAKNVRPDQNLSESTRQIAVEAINDPAGTLIENPYISSLSLLLPTKKYEINNAPRDAMRRNSGYFTGMDKDAGLIISGWFESSQKFKHKNIENMWRSQISKKAQNVEYLKINEWDVVLYETETQMSINGRALEMTTLRANLLRDGTWLRLRLSDTASTPEGTIALRKKLAAYTKAIRVTASTPRAFQLEHTSESISIIPTKKGSGRLSIVSKDIHLLQYDTEDVPGLFVFKDDKEKIRITAWVRPSFDYHYKTSESLWDEIKAALAKNKTPVIGEFSCEKIRDWDVMFYDVKTSIGKKYEINMRASRVTDGIWFDIRLTLSERRVSASLRKKLRAYMKHIIVTSEHDGY